MQTRPLPSLSSHRTSTKDVVVTLCYSTNPVHGSLITGIEVFTGGSVGFPRLPDYQHLSFDLNKGAHGKFTYPKLAPVTDICVLQSGFCHIYPLDDTWRQIK